MRRIAACIAAVAAVVLAAPVGTLAGDTPAPRTQTGGADAPSGVTAPPVVCPAQFPAAPQTPAQVERRAKCRAVWAASAPWSYSPELADFFVADHERRGIGPECWYSLCNARYSSGLRPKMSFRAGGMWARGLMDCTQLNGPRSAFRDLGTCDLFNPKVSIRNHCLEAAAFHAKTGREGWALQRKVFLPRSPDGRRAWAEVGKWRRVERRHLSYLAKWYAKRGSQS